MLVFSEGYLRRKLCLPLAKALKFALTFFESLSYSTDVFGGCCESLCNSVQEFAKYDVDDISAGLQDFLICVEMFIAALAHAYSFPPRDYLDPTHPKIGFIKSIKVMFDVRDVVDDVQYAVDDTVQLHT